METLKWVKACPTCEGNGCVEDEEDGLLWTCLDCNGTGEDVEGQRRRDQRVWEALRKDEGNA